MKAIAHEGYEALSRALDVAMRLFCSNKFAMLGVLGSEKPPSSLEIMQANGRLMMLVGNPIVSELFMQIFANPDGDLKMAAMVKFIEMARDEMGIGDPTTQGPVRFGPRHIWIHRWESVSSKREVTKW